VNASRHPWLVMQTIGTLRPRPRTTSHDHSQLGEFRSQLGLQAFENRRAGRI
jgi:hypothetical protein